MVRNNTSISSGEQEVALATYGLYGKYDQCGHALCNEHHHRELVAVVENDLQPWGQQMIDLL